LYSEKIARTRLDRIVDEVRKGVDPTFEPHFYTPGEVFEWIVRLHGAVNEQKEAIRPLSAVEERFILNELAICKADFRYWIARYARIKTKDATLEPIRLWESQRIILDRIAQVEEGAVDGTRGDGVIVSVLKARQLGASTLTEAMIAHRAFYYGNLMAIIAGDTPEQSAYLFDMIERIYEHLPWWMMPELTYHVKDAQMFFGKTDSLVSVYAAKSTRGSNDLELGKGQLGRGKTPHIAHLSELSTWPNPDQLDDSFFPAFPRTNIALCVMESTARGRGNWWHDTWRLAKRGLGRSVPIFIPWYAETQTYRRPAPVDWTPSDLALAHAKKALEVSHYWCGRTITLDRDQLYWWETMRAEYSEKKKLNIFLAEYCATDDEAFQNTSVSVFPSEVLAVQRDRAKPMIGLLEIHPRSAMVSKT
jgi:hypothetical protein